MSIDDLLNEIRQKLLLGQTIDEDLSIRCQEILNQQNEPNIELEEYHSKLKQENLELSKKIALAVQECNQIRTIIRNVVGN
jgi:hypothetical protein